MRIVIPLSLHSKRDADILAWIEQQPERERSAAIRRAVRAHINNGVTLADVYQAIAELKQGVIVAAPQPEPEPETDPELDSNLDALLNL